MPHQTETVGQAIQGAGAEQKLVGCFDFEPSFLADSCCNSSFLFPQGNNRQFFSWMAGKSWNAKSKRVVFDFTSFKDVCLFVCLFPVYSITINSFIPLFICAQSFPKKFESPDNELVSQVENEVGGNCWPAMHANSLIWSTPTCEK